MNIPAIDELVHECWQVAEDHGWHSPEDTIVAKLLLIHSEVSEAVEVYRNGKGLYYTDDTGKPEGLAVELADVIIRIFDLWGHLSSAALTSGTETLLSSALSSKIEYNKTRPYRHGNKLI